MFAHGFTFGGHPVAAAVALANLDIFEREDLCGHVRAQRGRVPRARSRACATCRSSATCAAPATSTRSSWSRTRTPRRPSTTRSRSSLLRGFLSGELYRRGLICRADDRGDPVVQLVAAADRRTASSSRRSRRSCAHVLSEAWDRVAAHGEEPIAMLTVQGTARRARASTLRRGQGGAPMRRSAGSTSASCSTRRRGCRAASCC